MPRAGSRLFSNCARQDAPSHPSSPPARRPAPRQGNRRRCRDRPRPWRRGRGGEAEANRRRGGSKGEGAWRVRRDWSWSATGGAGPDSGPAALLFHVKRVSASGLWPYQPPPRDRRFPSLAVSRETPLGHCPSFPRLAAEIGGKDTERSRRHAVDPARLPDSPGPLGLELGADLVGEAGHETVINVAQHHAFIASEGVDIGSLALEVDIVFRIDFQMDRNRWVNGRELGPDRPHLGPADLGIGE